MDANDILAIARFLMFLVAIGFFSLIYHRLQFKGFVTLSIGLAFQCVTLAFTETGVIQAGNWRYETLLLIVGVMYLISAYWLYKALVDFRSQKGKKGKPDHSYIEK